MFEGGLVILDCVDTGLFATDEEDESFVGGGFGLGGDAFLLFDAFAVL